MENNLEKLGLYIKNDEIKAISPFIIEESKVNVTTLDIFSKLMKERIIFIGDGIDDCICNIIQAQLLYLSGKSEKDIITCYINSPGGGVYAGLGIYDTLNFINNPIKTVNTGLAASMGAILLLAGDQDKRSALKHSRTMIHQPMGGVHGQVSDILITAKECEILKTELEDIIIEKTIITRENIKEYTDRDYWMTSVQAKELGFISTIL
jgi:ATP-dependent Clp protease protease subunit